MDSPRAFTVKQINFKVLKLIDFICFAILSLMLNVIILQVLFRYVLNQPLTWTEEFSRYLFIYMVFLGAIGVQKRKGHIGIQLFMSFLPAKIQLVVELIINLLTSALLIGLTYWGLKILPLTQNLSSTASKIPWMYLYAIIPVSMFIMAIIVFTHFGSSLKRLINSSPDS